MKEILHYRDDALTEKLCERHLFLGLDFRSVVLRGVDVLDVGSPVIAEVYNSTSAVLFNINFSIKTWIDFYD